jgi:hypothetical protein
MFNLGGFMPRSLFMIEYKGEKLLSQNLAEEFFKVSNPELVSLLLSKKLDAVILFGNPFIKITEAEAEELLSQKSEYIQVQSLDEQLKKLGQANKNAFGFSINSNVPFFKLDRKLFVDFTNLPYPRKYNHRNKIPHVKLCGSLYVCLDHLWIDKASLCFSFRKDGS